MNITDFLKKIKQAKHRIEFEKTMLCEKERLLIDLYGEEEIKADPSKEGVRLVLSFVGNKAPTVVICPGGAYEFVSMENEGFDYAKAFNEKGINAAILIYRVSEKAKYPNPMLDLAKAVEYVKLNAEKYSLDENAVYICGSSAGGHLAAYFAARYGEFSSSVGTDLRPNGVILSYPVISMCEETHERTRSCLIGANSTKSEREDKSVELIADESYPPTFLWHCEDDNAVPISNSIRLDKRLEEMGVRHKFCRYEQGGHGIGLAKGTSAEGWFEEAVGFFEL